MRRRGMLLSAAVALGASGARADGAAREEVRAYAR